MELTTSWKEEGIKEGRQEGRQEEGQQIVLRQLCRRWNNLTPQMKNNIRQLPVAQLEQLAEALLDFSSATDLEHWLRQH